MYRWGNDNRSDETGVSLYPEANDWAEVPVYLGVDDGAEIPVYPGVGDRAEVPMNPDGLWDTAVVLQLTTPWDRTDGPMRMTGLRYSCTWMELKSWYIRT